MTPRDLRAEVAQTLGRDDPRLSGQIVLVDPLSEARAREIVVADPACPQWLEAILLAERVQLMARGPDGVRELEAIYRDKHGPNARRRALELLLRKRMLPKIAKKGGAVELTIMCGPRWTCIEVAWSPRADEMNAAPCAQTTLGLDLVEDDWPQTPHTQESP